MDPITTSIIVSFCTSFLANYATDAVKHFFGKAIELEPSLDTDIKNARSLYDVEQLLDKATGVINANAGDASLEVDAALLEALTGIRFDHANGTISISGSTVSAPVIQYGGTGSVKGVTTITNTSSRSSGTSISVETGAQIKISGNAKITQS